MSEARAKVPHRPVQPLAYRVDEAAAVMGIGRAKLWALIAEGRIQARRIDGATVVRHSDLEDFLASAPAVEPKKPAQSSIR